MSTRCQSKDDGAACVLPLGHGGFHVDGGYIWCRPDEAGDEVRALRAEVARLKAEVKRLRARRLK